MTEERSEREIIAEAYSDDARLNWKAPVQLERSGRMYIPWDIHLEAYAAYCKKWSSQTALIDLKGRGCRGGFHTNELDGFIPGWRDRVSAFGKMKARLDALDPNIEAMGKALADLSALLKESGFLDKTANHLVYEAVVRAWDKF